MKKTLVVLSTFDGISCGLIALKALYPNYRIIYYVVEIDPKAIAISRHNHPDTIYLGDIREVTKNMIPVPVDILIGGSPCQSFSNAGKRDGFEGKSGLFWEFVRLSKIFKPKYFLLENVRMKKEWRNIITKAMKVDPILINSALVSAQNRERYYWTNIPGVTPPEDRGIKLSSIIKGAIGGYGRRGTPDGKGGYTKSNWTTRKDGKSNCLTRSDGCASVTLRNGISRPLTISEMEMLQTLPVGYTNVPGVCKTAKREAIGNGWTVDVIKHIFSFLPY